MNDKPKGPMQPAPSSSFLYPPGPVYEAAGEAAAPPPPPASSPLYPDFPGYSSAPPVPPAPPTLAVLDGPGLTTRFLCASPAFQGTTAGAKDLAGEAGDPVAFAIPPGADGKPIAVQLDATVSPLCLGDGGAAGDADRWGAISVALDPPDALLRPLPTGTKVTITPSWSTMGSRTIAAGRARAVLLVRATVQGA